MLTREPHLGSCLEGKEMGWPLMYRSFGHALISFLRCDSV